MSALVRQVPMECGTENIIPVIHVLWIKLHPNSAKSMGAILFNLIALASQLTCERDTLEGQQIKPAKEATIILHVEA